MQTALSHCAVLMLLLAVSVAFTQARPADDDLSIVTTIVTGERGKDSNSTTTIITLSGDKLTYHQSYHGAHSGGRNSVKKEYRLVKGDKNELIKSLREHNLLVTRTLAALPPNDEPKSYFSLLIRSRLNDKEHLITIKLPRNAPKQKSDRLYQNSVALVELLYRLIERTDPDILMPELIH